jgi:hypothetical protein
MNFKYLQISRNLETNPKMVPKVVDRRDDEISLKTRALIQQNDDFMVDFCLEMVFLLIFLFT